MTLPNYPKWAKIAMIISAVLILGRIILKIVQIKTPVDGFVNGIMNVAVGAVLVAIGMEIFTRKKISNAGPSSESDKTKERDEDRVSD
ncbi:hypothetical protein SAMN05216323_107113 [Williamwhitmania taraxaci]|uniref:Uncharacterized protein n=2 Tax=Williamwhitmania taraxaci TaxID=1640674 RepID=A0A1G6RAE1_9BACT|nr:hypothetical protein SAMN05216323_107113 [Williamwhitmania taraxaci]